MLLPDCDLAALLQRPELQAACAAFLADQPRQLPVSCLPTLCVLQGEYAALDASRAPPGLCIGSQDATTCLVAVVWCPISSWVWAAHLDEQQLGDRDMANLTDALQHMQQPCVALCGGYCDARGRGPATASAFLQLLHSLERQVQLRLCCVSAANTSEDGSPRSRQLVLDTSTWTPQPWLFGDRGPQVPRRFAAQHCRRDCRCTLNSIWCGERQQLLLSPFDACLLDSWRVLGYERLLLLDDSKLLAVMSTSPAHEPPWFCHDMRSMLAFLVAAQEPTSEERRLSGTTCRFAWDGQRWQPAQVSSPACDSTRQVAGPAGGTSA